MNGPRVNAVLAIALVLSACGGSGSGGASSTGGELAARPQRVADHETSAEPTAAVHAVAEPADEDGPMAAPPPVEPPSFEASAH